MVAAAGSVVSDEEIVAELRAAWAEVSRGYARCWAAMTEVARRTSSGWETAEIAAALSFTSRRADYELNCAQTLIDQLLGVYTALAAGELDHHKARVFRDYLAEVTPAQAERICARLVPLAPGWTTAQLGARLLREVQAIDPDYTRRSYQQAVRAHGTRLSRSHRPAVLSGSGLPAEEAAAAAARLEALADQRPPLTPWAGPSWAALLLHSESEIADSPETPTNDRASEQRHPDRDHQPLRH